MKITSHVTLITTGVHIDLCGAPKVEDNHQHAGERFVPALACWSATLHSTGVQLRESLESDLVRFCGDRLGAVSFRSQEGAMQLFAACTPNPVAGAPKRPRPKAERLCPERKDRRPPQRRASSTATIQIARPPSASAAPTQPVEVQP